MSGNVLNLIAIPPRRDASEPKILIAAHVNVTPEEELESKAVESPLASWRTMIGNFGVLAVSEAIARLMSFAAVIWMTHRLSLGGFGVVSLGTNLMLWFGMIANASRAIGLRDTARTPEQFKEITEPLLGMRLASSLVAMVALTVSAFFLGDTPHDRLVLLLYVIGLPILALNLRFTVLAVGSARPVAVGNVISQLVFAGAVFLFVQGPRDAIVAPLAMAGGELIFALILIAAMAPRYGMLMPRIDWPVWVYNLKQSGPVMVMQAGSATITWFDSVLIAILLGQAQVGLYSAAYRPILFATYSFGLLFTSFFAAYNAARSDERRAMLIGRTVRVTAAMSVPVAIVLSVGAGPLTHVLYGADYAGSAAPLAILAWVIPLVSSGSCWGLALISHGHQAMNMRHNLTGVAFNVAVNFAAIPLFGIVGAAAVTLCTSVIVVSLNYRAATRLGYAQPFLELVTGGRLRRASRHGRPTRPTSPPLPDHPAPLASREDRA